MDFINKRIIIPPDMHERDHSSHRGGDQGHSNREKGGRTGHDHPHSHRHPVVLERIIIGLDLSNGEGDPEDTDFPPGTSMYVARDISEEYGATVIVSPLDRIGRVVQSAVVIFQRGK